MFSLDFALYWIQIKQAVFSIVQCSTHRASRVSFLPPPPFADKASLYTRLYCFCCDVPRCRTHTRTRRRRRTRTKDCIAAAATCLGVVHVHVHKIVLLRRASVSYFYTLLILAVLPPLSVRDKTANQHCLTFLH